MHEIPFQEPKFEGGRFLKFLDECYSYNFNLLFTFMSYFSFGDNIIFFSCYAIQAYTFRSFVFTRSRYILLP